MTKSKMADETTHTRRSGIKLEMVSPSREIIEIPDSEEESFCDELSFISSIGEIKNEEEPPPDQLRAIPTFSNFFQHYPTVEEQSRREASAHRNDDDDSFSAGLKTKEQRKIKKEENVLSNNQSRSTWTEMTCAVPSTTESKEACLKRDGGDVTSADEFSDSDVTEMAHDVPSATKSKEACVERDDGTGTAATLKRKAPKKKTTKRQAKRQRKARACASSPPDARSKDKVVPSMKLTLKELESKENMEKRRRALNIGSRVYAAWTASSWYWAVVTSVERKKKSGSDMYSLMFDDEDTKKSVSLKNILSEEEYRLAYREEPPALPKKIENKMKKILLTRPSEAAAIATLTSKKKNTCRCKNCKRDACGLCFKCRSGITHSCFQKMCLKKKSREKAQRAVGFPKGWKFYFAEEKLTSRTTYHSVNHLYLTSPSLKHFLSAEAAVKCFKFSDGEKIVREFNQHVGIPESRKDASENESTETPGEFLLGRKFSFAWTNVNGQRKEAYGDVASWVREGANCYCNVHYTKESRAIMNAIDNDCGLAIPESQVLDSRWVLGACMRYEAQKLPEKPLADLLELPFYWKWVSPECRIENLVSGENNESFPSLNLIVHGFKLELNVKPSNIPKAGNGVFLRCTPIDGQSGDFKLNAGELIDLGVYGPFRAQDIKPEAVFYIKNFIHSFKCEEFAFDPNVPGCQFDITDDVTGEIHAMAKLHVCAYVNESDQENSINIHAHYDAENAVHYLLGNDKESQGEFSVPSDGREIEVLINYGPDYEKVRIRNGYSFCSEHKKNEIAEQLANEELEGLENVCSFTDREIESVVNFLFTLLSENADTAFSLTVLNRALISAALLRRRAQWLFYQGDDDANAMGTTSKDSLSAVLRKLRGIITILLQKTGNEQGELKQLDLRDDVDGFLLSLFTRLYSGEQLDRLRTLFE